MILRKKTNQAIFWCLILAVVFVIGCAPQIYTNPAFYEAKVRHKTIAILPFVVTIDSSKLPKEITAETIDKMQKDEAYLFQQELYTKFLTKQQKGEYSVIFQDIDETNALLGKSGIAYENLSKFTKKELVDVLGIDAIISGNIRRSQPMSTGSAVVIGVLFGAWGSTNRVDVSLTIHEGLDGQLLWKYDHEASGSVGSSSEKLADSLMKSISKKFPYKVE